MSGNHSDDSFRTARSRQSGGSAERERSTSPESDGSGPYPPSTSSSSRQSQSQSQSQYSQSSSQYSYAPSSHSAAAPQPGDSGWTRAANATLAAAPLAGQGAAMLGAQYGSDPNASLQGYGGAVGATAAANAAEVARQLYYARNVATNPTHPQPAPSYTRIAGSTVATVGGAVYGAGAGMNHPGMQGFGAMAQAVGTAVTVAAPQPMHDPSRQPMPQQMPTDAYGPTLPQYNQQVGSYLAQQQQQYQQPGQSRGGSAPQRPPAPSHSSSHSHGQGGRRRAAGGGGAR
ncbi:hypothetical protein [Streptomyces sp. SID5643]|uniref:hypothetical protein n=1 Tax=Streptomyces sp. SID5643 TaxID=2690307 RepID=UPI0013680E85|nr:hypothetical protein [Streptomyces sp. SID5643]MZF88498.1 hypothetical protein [Streptomyces sp. SID5643]